MKTLKPLLIAVICFVAAYTAGRTVRYYIDKNDKTLPISLPEEIQLAQPDDTLIVTSVSDSIYIGFKN
jgi:hypothetical protein